jgi:uncharacterized YigZ family protein
MEEDGKYRTISKSSIGEYKERDSKFIAHAIPCSDESSAKEHISRLRKEHHKAAHLCYAWRIGFGDFRDRFSDDGEPNNSAGKPIFGQILAHDLTNILIAVVRYYGGTKLGVGGLIQAYKTASNQALTTAQIEIKQLSNLYKVSFEIKKTGPLLSLLNQLGTIIIDQGFDNNRSTITFKVPISKDLRCKIAIQSHSNLELTFLRTEE